MVRSSMSTLAALVALLPLLAPAADAWYPRTAQVEMSTATWCTNCTYTYQGIAANQGWFDPSSFAAIRYYGTGGGLISPVSEARIAYYQGLYPDAMFDGSTRVSRGDTDYADGLHFRGVIERELCEPSYFKMTINATDFTAPSGAIDLDIELTENLLDTSNLYLRMMLIEDNVTYALETFQDVNRAQVGADIPITIDLQGEIQNVNQTFPIDAGWVGANLDIVAFIQDDDTQDVLASITTEPSPDYQFRYFAISPRVAIGPIVPNHHFAQLQLMNTGSFTDLFVMRVVTQGPAGWFGVLCVEGGCIGPQYETVLEPGQYEDFYVDLQAVPSGYGTATVEIYQDSRPERVARIKYTYITDDVDVLIVDDDGARTHQNYYKSALDHYGYSYGVWDHDAYGAPAAADMAQFEAVIWEHGRVYPTVDALDRAALGTYLDGGGRLFISGADLGYDLDNLGGEGYTWYEDYLHTNYFNNNANDYTLLGVPGDVISDGIDLTIQGGDGANNQISPDDIRTLDAQGTLIWKYDATKGAAMRIDGGAYRAVYLAFGFEAIDNASQRQGIMNRILGWFHGLSAVDEGAPVLRPQLTLTPNPMLGPGTVRFSLPAPENVRVRMYAADGRLVATLADGPLEAGGHSFAWNRLDAAGRPLPAGVYYCRVTGERTELEKKTVVMR